MHNHLPNGLQLPTTELLLAARSAEEPRVVIPVSVSHTLGTHCGQAHTQQLHVTSARNPQTPALGPAPFSPGQLGLHCFVTSSAALRHEPEVSCPQSTESSWAHCCPSACQRAAHRTPFTTTAIFWFSNAESSFVPGQKCPKRIKKSLFSCLQLAK